VMIALVSLLTSGEKARGVALRVLGVVALVVGGMAALYFFRSMPSRAQVAMTPWAERVEIAERPLPPPAPVPTVAPPVQPPMPEHDQLEVKPEQTVPPAQADAAPAEGTTKPTETTAETPTEPAETSHEHVTEPAPVTDTPAPSDASATTAVVAEEKSADDHAVESKVAETSRAQRPEWIDQDARRIGSDYYTHASSGLFTTLEEAERALEPKARQVVADYAGLYLGEEAAGRIPIDEALVRRLSRERYEEHRDVTVGRKTHQMVQIHQQLVIDEPARHELKARWENVLRTGRLWYLGVGALLVVALIGTLFSYLKLDLMTGGSYRGRLQLAVAAAILVSAAAALIVRL
jgi:hypothetical protein